MPSSKYPLAVEIIDPFLQAYPVDVRAMAKALGLKVVEERLPDTISGKLERDWWNDYVVTINRSHSETRKRFTIAHEIAHYVLHRDLIEDGIVDNALYRDDRIGDAFERQANRYAATLLMPQHMVRDAWDRGQRTAVALARSFHVSEAVAQIRISELGCERWDGMLDEIPFCGRVKDASSRLRRVFPCLRLPRDRVLLSCRHTSGYQDGPSPPRPGE